ncbi:tripartite tricarboxylate transporter substrate binding protein [Ammoniphilus sp. YIM 78166]|uniref:Bug family tripartite tricarboxylate transporter substrate binding protein n=1 Tax=Ammoniphilus sp. YIM 78166 TaxID=1644106 RepID=UPI00106FECB3|nr:tripartite tricarboxylate transporter substrate binding protein [Ammoniphilus sp. YIM 78166]
MRKRLGKWGSFLSVGVMMFALTMGCSSNQSNTQEASNTPAPSTSEKQEAVNYPTKEIKLVVPYSPGGGFDTSARLVAPFMEKYLPNSVSVIVDNKPGGQGNIGLGDVYKAKPDGYTIGIINLPGNVVKQIQGDASYDVTKFEYIGRITDTIYVAAASKKSGFKTLDDLKNAKAINAGITNISSSDGLGVVVTAEKLGFDVKTIPHEGSTEAVLSAVRGDVDWIQFPMESIRASVIDSKELVPLWVYSKERHPDLPDVPTIVELGYGELLDTVSGHRVLIASPETPQEVLTILRDAFQKVVQDPEYQKKAIDAKSDGNSGDHELAKQIAESSLKQLEPLKEKLNSSK